MRWSIGKRIFTALTATSLVVILLDAIATRWSFQRGFENYISEQELSRVEEIADDLRIVYVRAGSWDAIRSDPRIWDELLRPRGALGGGALRFVDGPPAMGGMGPAMGRPPPPDPFSLHPRLALLDADGNSVAGRNIRSENARQLEIVVGDSSVGTLLIENAVELTEAVDVQFAADQGRATIYISVAILLFAALVALVVSRQMVRPISRLTHGTKALTGGEFEHRITVTRDDELGDLARDFNELAQSLEKNRQMRRQWVADISHELRTPLTILNGELQALEDGVRTYDEGTHRSLLAEVQRLNKLVADLHELTVSDEGGLKLFPEPLNIAATLKDIVEDNRSRIEGADIKLLISIPERVVRVEGDYSRLEQLTTNLIENTIRYTDRPGTLSVSLETVADQVVIEFADSAPGVAAEHLPQLFDRLFRVDSSRNRAAGGSGLGLSICASIVKAHGGSISAAPSNFGGVAVSVSLPLATAETSEQ